MLHDNYCPFPVLNQKVYQGLFKSYFQKTIRKQLILSVNRMSPYDAEDYQRVATSNNFNVSHGIVKCDEWCNYR